MKVLFVDATCPRPYDKNTLTNEPLGGTEATVIRVAEALSSHAQVTVSQHNREAVSLGETGVLYTPYSLALFENKFDKIVYLRTPSLLSHHSRFRGKPESYLWLHDFTGNEFSGAGRDWANHYRPTIIGVSKTHKTDITERLRALNVSTEKIVKIYNPIDDSLSPETDCWVNKYSLTFFSSPHKGLKNTVRIFLNLLNFNVHFKLYIANPGYFSSPSYQHPSIIPLGTLTHKQAIFHVVHSLCVFYPNTVFPETFGLVFAEANAVGTPVLAHNFGAAHEVLGGPPQTLDCRDDKAVIDRVMAWHGDNRPIVRANPKFRTSSVVKDWLKLFKI